MISCVSTHVFLDLEVDPGRLALVEEGERQQAGEGLADLPVIQKLGQQEAVVPQHDGARRVAVVARAGAAVGEQAEEVVDQDGGLGGDGGHGLGGGQGAAGDRGRREG
jgi:hypothetical protein